MPLIAYSLCCAAESPALGQGQKNALAQKAADAHDVLWSRFFSSKTNIFYDYITSYEAGKGLETLPTPDEIAKNYPNMSGHGTGMEDGMILAGVMLCAVLDRNEAAAYPEAAAEAKKIFEGIKLASTAHGVRGFIARAVTPVDGKSAYVSASRDQITHAVHGLWRYFHSPLSDEKTKKECAELVAAVAERMIKNVTPENDYDYLSSDGRISPLRYEKMWEVKEHEAARLPMIYLAAFDMTGENKYRQEYEKYIDEALGASVKIPPSNSSWSILQAQCSFELIRAVEKNPQRLTMLEGAMLNLTNMSQKKLPHAKSRFDKVKDELPMLASDWRKPASWDVRYEDYRFPRWGRYHEIWYAPRGVGELGLIIVMAGKSAVSAEDLKILSDTMLEIDYFKISSCSIAYHYAYYWRGKRLGFF